MKPWQEGVFKPRETLKLDQNFRSALILFRRMKKCKIILMDGSSLCDFLPANLFSVGPIALNYRFEISCCRDWRRL